MENFTFYTPTKIYFGKDQIKKLPQSIAPYGKRVLLVYGGGSIKRNGIYDQVTTLLTEQGFEITELSGVEPNPRLETVEKGVKLCRDHQIEGIIAIGGGSTIDCSKAISAGVFYEGSPWDFTKDSSLITKTLPLFTVLTMAATGSEMNWGAVITNVETNEKLGIHSVLMIPKVSILDPTYTYTVPTKHTAAGSVDILSHLLENYFSQNKGAYVQDRISEGIMRTVINYAPQALKQPDNYEARANLMWSSTLALNGLTGRGKVGTWSCHPMEHELSAFYDITHGIGLAILTPRWMKYILNEDTVEQMANLAHYVWDIPVNSDNLFETAEKGIQAFYDCFVSWGIPMTLEEVGIPEDNLQLMAEKAVEHSTLATTAYVPLAVKDVKAIYENCLTQGI